MEFNKGCLILNPSAGKLKNIFYLKKILDYFCEKRIEISLKKSRDIYDLRKKTEETLKENFDFIGVMGGDGTVREVCSILIQSKIPVLIIPFGTSNVLAYSLGIPQNPFQALKVFENKKIREIDCGIINGSYFFYSFSTGVDAILMAKQNIFLKKLFGRFYFYPLILKTFISYDFPEIIFRSEDLKENCFYVCISNVKHFGGKYLLFENSSPFDGYLDFLVFKEKSIKKYFRFFLNLKKGKQKEEKNATFGRAKEIFLEGKGEVPYQIDGDFKGFLPVKINVKEKAIKVFMP